MQVHSPLTFGACKEHFNEFMDSCHHYLDILPEERMRDVSRMNYNPDPDFRPPTPDVLSSGPPPSRRQMPAIYPYAYRKLLDLQIQMPVLFFSVAQAAQLMALFPQEGYLRIQLLLAVFSHLTDAENLCDIYDNLSADERAELVHRVGILCVTDPMRPDREYHLDLRRWDQREMCKILIQLGINEPGDNWVDGGEYRWSKFDGAFVLLHVVLASRLPNKMPPSPVISPPSFPFRPPTPNCRSRAGLDPARPLDDPRRGVRRRRRAAELRLAARHVHLHGQGLCG